MQEFFIKRVVCVLMIVLVSGCSKEEFVNVDEKEKITDERIYEKWQEGIEAYDLDIFIEEEKKNKYSKKETTREEKEPSENPVYVHYMPWFQSLEIDGFWGQHWTMKNRDPTFIDAQNKREIASHYYPLIGPYSTRDKDLQQYHLLLMKLSGVDGVIFDWYGQRDVLDFENIKLGMESFIEELDKTDLEFAVMYEDRVIKEQRTSLTAIQISQAVGDLQYVEEKYFSKENYINIKENPLFMVFGPNYIDAPEDWHEILSLLKREISLLTLWGSQSKVGENNSVGEYAWIDENHIQTVSGYYNYVIDFDTNIVGGIVYPGFNDYYIEGGWKSNLDYDWQIENKETITFQETFDETLKHEVDFIQVATWNDFGEGTQIEPTLEYGFKYLNLLQKYTEASYTEEDLKIPYYIYKLRKLHPNNETVTFLLDIAYTYALKGNVKKAKRIIGLTIFHFGDDFLKT